MKNWFFKPLGHKIQLMLFAALGFGSLPSMTQTKYLLPLGNSITQGKYDDHDPLAGEHGYRRFLYDQIHAKYNIDFVGPYGTAPYLGHFRSGAKILDFLPDSGAYDVRAMLNALANKPDYVLLHLGTNDMASDKNVGTHTTAGTILYDLWTLLDVLLDYNSESIEQIFLCKIIPKAPFTEFPGQNAKTMDYNSRIDLLWNALSVANRNRVTIVNMHATFYSNQFELFNVDNDPATEDDHLHPAYPEGYQAMADIWADYIDDYLTVPVKDEFDRAAGLLDGRNGWVENYFNTVRIWDDPGDSETPGGTVYSDASGDQNWDYMAIWSNSKNKNTVSFRFHPNCSAHEDTIHRVGVLMGMDTTIVDPTDPLAVNGYMIFAKKEEVFLYLVESGQLSTMVSKRSFPVLVPGDSVQVTMTSSSTMNRFDFEINGVEDGSLTHSNPAAKFRPAKTFAGIIFRGQSGDPSAGQPAVYLDWFKAETKNKDVIPPGTIANLSVISEGSSTVTLQWTAVGDNGVEGQASSYDLRFSTNSIGPSTFEEASIITSVPVPGTFGTIERATVKGLLSGVTYYFAIKAVDRWGNKSNISNLATGVTEPVGEVSDSFEDRTSMGPDWVCDEDEYQIDTVRDEMMNVLGTGSWGSAAIYKGRSNPTLVRVVLGSQYQPWASGGGNENFGIVVLAEDTTLTAGGYLIMIRKRYNVIYLYDIHWEGATRTFVLLDAAAYGLTNYPVAGDEIAVVVDWKETAYNRFDIYVNSRPASRFALYDNQKLYGNVARNWSGLILSQMSGTRNNNIASFTVSGEKSAASGIQAVSAVSFQDTVGKTLADSLKVRVLSLDGVPLEDAPVFFKVTQGNAQVTTTQPANGRVYIEAEWWNDLRPPMIQLDLPGETDNAYIVSTERTPDGTPRGYAEYQVYIDTPGKYHFWARTKWTGSYTNQLLNFEMRLGATYLTGVGGFLWYIQKNEGASSNWKWGKIRNVNTWFAPDLVAGIYTIRVYTHHKDVPVDKIMLTRETTTNLDVTLNASPEPTGAIMTNSQGEAGTRLTLGTTAGTNLVAARPFGTDAQVTFTAVALAAKPSSFTKTNDNQTGNAGAILTNPFIVTYKDQYGNVTPGVTVNFAVSGTVDGSVNPASAVTDASGRAQTVLTLGYQSSTYNVHATVAGVADTAKFKATVNAGSGLIGQLIPQAGTGYGQRHYVNQSLPNFLKVQVLNDKTPPQPVVGTPIVFQVTEGNATVGAPVYYTNSQGVATGNLTMGPNPERVVVIAKTNLIQTTVVVDTAFNKGSLLSWYSGGGYVLDLGAAAPAPCEVAITDKDGFAVAGQQVTFIADGGGFHFQGGGELLLVNTDSRGVASANVVAGRVQGVYKGVVRAYANDGFKPINGAPFNFDFHVKSQASSLTKVAGDNLTGVVRNLVGPIGVRMINRDGTVVIPNQPVHFTRTKGDGYFGGSLPKTTVTDTTDDNGMVWVYYRLGSQAGVNNNGIVAWTKNGRDSLFANFTFSSKSSNAYRISPMGSTNLTGTVGKPLSQPVTVVITDSTGNKKKEAVTFSVILGHGSLNGTADTTEVVYSDSITGLAQIQWTMGKQAGVQNTLRAEARNGLMTLVGSPLIYSAVPVHDSVSLGIAHSTVSATGPIQATNQDTSHITIVLRDKYDNPVPGMSVTVAVKGGVYDSWLRTPLQTDATGTTRSYLYSRSAGIKTVKVVVDGDTLEQSAQVTCLAQSATTIQLSSGDGQTGNAGTVLKNPLVVRVTDGINPVAFTAVTFVVTAGGGSIVGSANALTDANGLASTQLILGNQVGTLNNEVEARATGLIGTPVRFKATGRTGVAHTMTAVSEFARTGKAGEVLPDPFVVSVKDIDQNAVANVKITFQIEGSGSFTSNAIVYTNAFGLASIYYRAPTQAGNISLVKAVNNSLGSPITFSVTAIPGDPRKLHKVSGDLQEGFVGGTLMNSLVVKTTDLYNNPVGSQPVQFIIQQGDATIEGSHSITRTSNSQGLASVLVTLGLDAGTVIIHAVNSDLEGSPTIFTANAKPVGPVNLAIYSGNNQKGTVGHGLVDPLRVIITDTHGNPVPSYSVRFFKVSGGGQIVGSETATTNSLGIASASYRVGLTVGTDVVRATSIGQNIDFSVQAVYNTYFPVLNKTAYSRYNQKREKEYLTLALIATDGNASDQLTFQAFEVGKLTLPTGARVITEGQAPRTGIFEWTPDYNQQGTYRIVLRVIDNMGGSDADTVTVEVQNVNRKPRIVTTKPSVQDTTVMTGTTVIFWVDARDDDNDPVTYSWKVDGQSVSGSYAVYHHYVSRSFPGTQTAEVTASDGVSSVKYLWNLDVRVSVQMSQFAAKFEGERGGVWIRWTTAQETGNTGFHVLRSESESSTYSRLNEELISSQEEGEYAYLDRTVKAGAVYFYKIVSVDGDGRETEFGPLMVQVPQPDTYLLAQNYPNPFNPQTTIHYQIPRAEHVTLIVYNMMGQAIRVLFDAVQNPGYHQAIWDAKDEQGRAVSTGIYVYRLKTSSTTITKRMVLMK